MENQKMLTTKELSEIIGVHPETLYIWAKEGMPRIELGKKTIRYDLEEVMAWLQERSDQD